jgi:hypothetical protein
VAINASSLREMALLYAQALAGVMAGTLAWPTVFHAGATDPGVGQQAGIIHAVAAAVAIKGAGRESRFDAVVSGEDGSDFLARLLPASVSADGSLGAAVVQYCTTHRERLIKAAQSSAGRKALYEAFLHPLHTHPLFCADFFQVHMHSDEKGSAGDTEKVLLAVSPTGLHLCYIGGTADSEEARTESGLTISASYPFSSVAWVVHSPHVMRLIIKSEDVANTLLLSTVTPALGVPPMQAATVARTLDRYAVSWAEVTGSRLLADVLAPRSGYSTPTKAAAGGRKGSGASPSPLRRAASELQRV